MKPFARITLVIGLEKDFNGELTRKNLRAFVREEDAIDYGSNWAREKREEFKNSGRKAHASYQLEEIELC